ncbi:MEKHLA domain-containing protein [Streptomyces liangshanensis]|uniref:MEKHLA domain-containing protein n=1 Tax=Streptomyces liangshanensis TaxID=2717324 RepID=A0A6G9GU79_9ACTN|nr:MEKHLA domain-containing protein [Streptomyces liangshanensis]QIQ01823.1 MEKHLA domain-containing protein [Streptomyces liangshanensis]
MSLPDPYGDRFSSLLADTYRRLTGKSLLADMPPGATDAARWLYEKAPFGLLAHDTAEDPRFVYANRTVQSFFGYEWEEFIGMPSRLSAPPAKRSTRAKLMKDVLERGYSDHYRGIREGRSGTRFWIEDVTIWNLVDEAGRIHGQAALIRSTTPA